jgi:ABC-type sugar transport system ATPase subunit
MTAAGTPLLEFRGITKGFPGQLANDDVSFAVRAGEVHALVGENGAGKTTLVKILAGELSPDAGELLLDGRPVRIARTWQAAERGIGFIHQEPALVPRLSVAENVTLGLRYQRALSGRIDWRRHHRLARRALDEVGLDVDERTRLGDLSAHEQQLVAIARVLLLDLRVVVLDEVTAPLTKTEVDRLFQIVRRMRDRGVAVVYISHRLEEIFALADRVTVLKDGRWVATEPVGELSRAELTRLIIGRDPTERFRGRPASPAGAPVLSVRGLRDDVLDGVSFDLHAGEILGIAGLAGAGRTNVLEALFGARPADGEVSLDGQPVRFRSPADAVARGIALVTEDRKRDGYVPGFPLWKHLTLPWLRGYRVAGFLVSRRERAAAARAAARFDVRAPSLDTPLRDLSGGNQQKAILARWMSGPPAGAGDPGHDAVDASGPPAGAGDPGHDAVDASGSIRVLLLDEPTHGVDVGAKEEIYRIIRELAAAGTAVLLVSSDLSELEGLCARVLLLSEGRLLGTLTGEQIERGAMLSALYARKEVVHQ